MAIVVKGGGRRSTQQRPGKEEPLVGMEEGGGEKKNCSSVGCSRGVGGGAPAPKFSATKLYDCDVCLVALPSPRRRLKGRSVESPTIE